MKKIIYFLTFILCMSLALAVTVTTDKTDYSHPENVQLTVAECTGNSVLKVFLDSADELVDIKSGENSWVTSYNTNSNLNAGKYKIKVNCANGNTEQFFCVDSPGCYTVPPITTTPSPGGGNINYCSSKWECGTWSLCNATLEQSRTCTDKNGCDKPKKEVQSCEECKESWFCSLWNDCSNGVQKRTCVDDHSCGTTFKKPLLQKNCNQITVPGPQPQKIEPDLPPPAVEPQIQQPTSSYWNYWNQYKTYIIGIPSVLSFIIVLILVVVHFVHPHRKAYNFDELKTWIHEEKRMGTSDEGVREILKHNTGWTDQEINKAFGELKSKAQ
ncbi:hypothetical protein HOE37_05240 [Candidatus Woesearchaeota archaeon]|jgi:hypothetical protein|nr:hypothetical protein [Candidatus Woesearchaeota archaeon]MBT4111236.1 hypothetical protein [Candidatus Woesearchaeota archaeon]MBT4336816.1 hypothetical protein [Candidatus Woesearchaeota archaeon]MBT4469484.1 hypothetical protein [Candidatus Woesearchaeota archaeon]MBT6744121.1 hypothetical protein [Candidatus Woesearchaeota archaeon]